MALTSGFIHHNEWISSSSFFPSFFLSMKCVWMDFCYCVVLYLHTRAPLCADRNQPSPKDIHPAARGGHRGLKMCPGGLSLLFGTTGNVILSAPPTCDTFFFCWGPAPPTFLTWGESQPAGRYFSAFIEKPPNDPYRNATARHISIIDFRNFPSFYPHSE